MSDQSQGAVQGHVLRLQGGTAGLSHGDSRDLLGKGMDKGRKRIVGNNSIAVCHKCEKRNLNTSEENADKYLSDLEVRKDI